MALISRKISHSCKGIYKVIFVTSIPKQKITLGRGFVTLYIFLTSRVKTDTVVYTDITSIPRQKITLDRGFVTTHFSYKPS